MAWLQGHEKGTVGPRVALTALHALSLGAAALVLAPSAVADPGRRTLLLACGVFLFARSSLSVWLLRGRPLGWIGALARAAAAALSQLVMAAAGRGAPGVGAVDALGLGFLVLGHGLSLWAEVGRLRAARRGDEGLLTAGLFSVVRYPGLLGDLLWGLGWAALTHNWRAGLVPGLQVVAFAFFAIPFVDAQLRARHGAQFEAWAARTRRLIPFLY